MEDSKTEPTYKYATLTDEQIGAITAINVNDLKDLTTGFNGLTTSDIKSMTISPISSQTIDTLSTISLTGGISPGYTLSSGGTGSNLTWNSPNVWNTTGPYYTTSAVGSAVGATLSAGGKPGQLNLRGEDADIIVNDKSLMKMLERIEERLVLLTPNTDLESEWDELKELGDRYRELEKRCKEKAEVWKKLKDMPPPKLD